MINNSSPDTKRPRTDAGRVETQLPQQDHHHFLHHHKQQQQTKGEDIRVLRSPYSCWNQHAGESQRDPKIYCAVYREQSFVYVSNRADAKNRYTANYCAKKRYTRKLSSHLRVFRDADWSTRHCNAFWRNITRYTAFWPLPFRITFSLLTNHTQNYIIVFTRNNVFVLRYIFNTLTLNPKVSQ